MEKRMGLLFLLALGAVWASDARELANPDHWSKLSKKPDVCALCEEYTAKALDYLHENKTQNEITDILHNTCYQLRPFKQKCITLVDYYAPLFFLEIASIQPGELCHKVNLCEGIAYISLQVQANSYGFCKDTISTLLAKLKDSNTECRRMVFDYGPLVFDNAEKFLEMTDICSYTAHYMPSRLQQWLPDKPFFLSLNYGNNVFTQLMVNLFLKIAIDLLEKQMKELQSNVVQMDEKMI
ncbi:hypothetical protein VNO77_20720 [Canavalia gladiata]|uniref:Pulmonary surfactant-associated protein B n=1 Tax=Canavalia gladiata TaxID=3824 RepID=A0AAN9LUV0_CANGL